MPTEKFYHPAVIEGHEHDAFDEGRAFEVAWGRVTYQDQPCVAVAGIPLDESGVTRLIAALRRAKRQTFPGMTITINNVVTPSDETIAEAVRRAHGSRTW